MAEIKGYDPELERLVEYFHRIWESAILTAALDLDLFGALHDGPRTAGDIASELGLDPKGVRILLDALCPAGFIEKEGDRYRETAVSARYLDPRSESYPGPIHGGAATTVKWEALGKLAESVRKGGPVVKSPASREDSYRRLVKAIAHTADYATPVLAKHLGIGEEGRRGWRILDVACGSGAYGLGLMDYDATAHLTFNDLPGVLEVARERAEAAGLAGRIDFLPGDIFEVEPAEGAYDLILLSQLLHSLSREDCAFLVKKLAAAQRRGGYLAVHEFVPDEARRERRFPLLFAMNMYISNGVGDTYTFSEISRWMESAGYTGIEFLDTPGRSSFVIGRLG
jgi:SAM-dependent methyltransferase/predicted transcriptional regulator